MTEEERLDKELLKEVGDARIIEQKGSVNLTNGDKKEVDLEITRTRNADGGVDVNVNVKTPLTLQGKKNN